MKLPTKETIDEYRAISFALALIVNFAVWFMLSLGNYGNIYCV